MGKFVTLKTELNELRQVDPRLVSYNVEMTEVTGGTFWKAYTDAQVDGTEEFPIIKEWSNMGNLQQWYDPIDTTNPRLIKLAKELGIKNVGELNDFKVQNNVNDDALLDYIRQYRDDLGNDFKVLRDDEYIPLAELDDIDDNDKEYDWFVK